MNESQSDNIAQPAGGSDNGPSAQARESGWLARLKASLGLVSDRSLRASLETALEQPERLSTAFSPEERLMLLNILGFRELRVEDVMVPRADIIACEENVLISDLMKLFHTAGHSRIPVYRETLDEPIGMVHIKDVMNAITKGATLSKAELAARKTPVPGGLDLKRFRLNRTLASTRIVRKMLFVPPSMPALDLLAQMQATRIHMAIVIDEYGGTDGLVTIEDLMEEIVGDIEDEHDNDDETMIRTAADGSLVVDARMPIEEISEETGIAFDAHEASDEIDTLGGLVFTLVGRIPVRGELIPYSENVELEVVDADPRRIKRLKIHRRSPKSGQLETAD